MEKIARNERFLRRLAKSKKRQAIRILKNSSDEEFQSVVQVFLSAKDHLDDTEKQKCSAISKKLKSLRKITKKALISFFVKYFKQVIALVALLILRLFESGITQVYCLHNG